MAFSLTHILASTQQGLLSRVSFVFVWPPFCLNRFLYCMMLASKWKYPKGKKKKTEEVNSTVQALTKPLLVSHWPSWVSVPMSISVDPKGIHTLILTVLPFREVDIFQFSSNWESWHGKVNSNRLMSLHGSLCVRDKRIGAREKDALALCFEDGRRGH